MASQWERLLKNAGTWVGSFTQLSAQGDLLQDTPSVVALKPLNGGNLMRQEITKHPAGEPAQETVLEYRSLAKSVLFLENGAFSQGSIQWGPFSEFGAELGLIADHHRLRLVQLFDKTRQLSQLTLIREHLKGTAPSERPQLTLAALVGTWVGEAVTVYPDLQPSDTYPTQLEIVRQGSTLQQTLQFGEGNPPIQSQGTILDNRIVFETGSQAVQVLLLPDGASSTCPTHIEPRQPILLEVGWLIAPNQRQRLIRQYNAQGGWASLTLVTETRR
ncbi:DUF3598 family protein [Oscillatoria sp. CS-180]|uniref:DUF3598 family protein n=1 Tax=Oscillatoria sp. CS-180 TaxID=3021720 RepID=UPI00232F9A27|nr:DUF3598 family protein [Oscillatoria sp. CS-180]MDB9526339.1 DUF3598 family protein [Oscillatoria sp. CS-180]